MGRRKITQAEFIERARAAHGDAYDYSQTVVDGMTVKVAIKCSIHGVFWQTPARHVSGRGCPQCGHARHRVSREDFIKRARAVHGDKYDYSDMQLTGMRDDITIRCPKHGLFTQSADHHLRGQGCPACGWEQRAATNLERYGAENVFASEYAKEKMRETNLKKFGVEHPMQNDDVKRKLSDKFEREYGVRQILAAPSIRAQIRKTCEARYGGPTCMSSPEVRERLRQTCIERYDCETTLEAGHALERMQEIAREHGVKWPTQIPAIQAKIVETKRARGTFHTSAPEEELYGLLCEQFGADDIDRQHRDAERYPFACDFYIKSLDLFIELNASWTHGGHWFDPNSPNDLAKVAEWKDKVKRGHMFYAAALETWVKRDSRKLACARSKGINYLVFWDNDLTDAEAWLASLRRDEEMI